MLECRHATAPADFHPDSSFPALGARARPRGTKAGRPIQQLGWAGSDDNATNLVEGLRTGQNYTLIGNDGSTTVVAGTGRSTGWGNVSHTLALASALTDSNPDIGISGALAQVSALRSSGMGWGEIAHGLGLNLGSVVSGHDKAVRSSNTATHESQSNRGLGRSGNDNGEGRSASSQGAGQSGGHGGAGSASGGSGKGGGGRGNAGGGKGGGH
ncbi:hypothetical protein ACTSKR_03195 [Chitinibacteraceae bacterium HSL-7]